MHLYQQLTAVDVGLVSFFCNIWRTYLEKVYQWNSHLHTYLLTGTNKDKALVEMEYLYACFRAVYGMSQPVSAHKLRAVL
jgi:phage terminase small subunit